jgi:hypothetical protein
MDGGATVSLELEPMRPESVHGKLGDDGVERISTQTLFDILEVPQRSHTAAACRRLAKLIREFGWSPIKARGRKDQVRGYGGPKMS